MMLRLMMGAGPVRPGYWFAQKRYGLGSVPATWQGWVLTLAFVVLFVGALRLMHSDGARLATGLTLIVIYSGICWLKTDGGWRWRWG